jgi:hypothetical protein
MNHKSFGTYAFTEEDSRSSKIIENVKLFKDLDPIVGTFGIYYGEDHVVGVFLQLYPKDDSAKDWLTHNCPGEDECFDVDDLFCGLTMADLDEFLNIVEGG